MALTFYLGNSTTTLGSGAAFNRFLEPNTGTPGSISVTLHHSGPLQQDGFAFTRDNALASVDWVDQSIIVKLNVTSSAAIDCRLSAARVDSNGVIQTEGGQSGYISFNSTGVKTFTIGSNGGWGTPSDTDRLMIRYDFFYPSGSKGGRTIEFETNTANSSVETPFVLDVFTPPSVTTNAASGIGLYGATLNGNLSELGDATTVDRFFEWREVGVGTWNTTNKNAQGSTGTFSQAISSLDHNTNYEFRAVAEYIDGTTQRVEGTTLTFTTDTFTAPSVTTSAASGIGETGATLNGNLSALGDATTVDRFFEWKEVGGPTWNTTTKNPQTVTGAFSQGISGLSSNTDYEFRAVAEYEDGGTQRVEGTTLTFTTSSYIAPSVTTSAASDIASITATLNGDLSSLGSATSVGVYFNWREVGAGTWTITTTQSRSTTGVFNQAISGLTFGTDYEFQAIVSYNDGTEKTVTGNTLTFQTIAYTLSITREGNGSVSVEGTPVTLPYSESFALGASISLQATADLYHSFTKWVVNSVDDLTNPTSLTMSEDKTVVVHFAGDSKILIERATGEGEFALIDEELSTSTSYKDAATLSVGIDYRYRIKKIVSGVVQTAPTLSGELDFNDNPASVSLTWVDGGGIPTDGMVLHLDADAITGLNDNDTVTTWSDLSGNSNNATQAVEGNRPKYVTNAINGKPAIYFDGDVKYVAVPDSPELRLDNQSHFIVFSAESSGNEILTLINKQGAAAHQDRNYWLTVNNAAFITGGAFWFRVADTVASGLDSGSTSVLDVGAVLGSVVFNRSATTYMYLDGEPVSNQDITTVPKTPTAPLGIGVQLDGGSVSSVRAHKGYIAEIIIYNRALTTEEREQVEQYLGKKWLGWV